MSTSPDGKPDDELPPARPAKVFVVAESRLAEVRAAAGRWQSDPMGCTIELQRFFAEALECLFPNEPEVDLPVHRLISELHNIQDNRRVAWWMQTLKPMDKDGKRKAGRNQNSMIDMRLKMSAAAVVERWRGTERGITGGCVEVAEVLGETVESGTAWHDRADRGKLSEVEQRMFDQCRAFFEPMSPAEAKAALTYCSDGQEPAPPSGAMLYR